MTEAHSACRLFLTGQDALAYIDRRTLDRSDCLAPLLAAYGFDDRAAAAAQPGAEVTLTLSIPGALAAHWFCAPLEREPDFQPVFSAVSVAVQAALRRWLPYVYFSGLDRFADPRTALPLLVYQVMRPFSGGCRGEFTHDVVSPDAPQPEWAASAARPLAAELARIHSALAAAGRKELARSYAPDQARAILRSVVRRPAPLNSLLKADAICVDHLVELAARGRRFSELAARDPRRTAKELARLSEDFAAAFHRRLRRLYNGESFVFFGPLLLAEATAALANIPIAAALHLRCGDAEQAFLRS